MLWFLCWWDMAQVLKAGMLMQVTCTEMKRRDTWIILSRSKSSCIELLGTKARASNVICRKTSINLEHSYQCKCVIQIYIFRYLPFKLKWDISEDYSWESYLSEREFCKRDKHFFLFCGKNLRKNSPQKVETGWKWQTCNVIYVYM